MRYQLAPILEQRLGRHLQRLFGGAAIVAGMILCAIVLMTIVSVVGRGGFNAPVTGDYELVEMATAVAVFLMLPYVQFNRGHVAVGLLTDRASLPVRKGLELLANLIMTFAAIFIAWRTQIALGDKLDNGEVSYLLGVPRWVPFLGAVIGCYLWAIASLFSVWRAFNDMVGAVAADDGGVR